MPATAPRGHQRSASPLGKIAIVRVAATGSAAVLDALFGAGGLGSGAPSVLSIERFAADALSTRSLLVLISWARQRGRPRRRVRCMLEMALASRATSPARQ